MFVLNHNIPEIAPLYIMSSHCGTVVVSVEWQYCCEPKIIGSSYNKSDGWGLVSTDRNVYWDTVVPEEIGY